MKTAKGVLLVSGGASIVGSGLYTLNHLSDHVVINILVPGFVFGLILIGIAMSLERDRWHWFGR